ncbi:sialate O-acetylesterase [Telluribacter sp. SYSU D00476]|uniref:sialate O-acetylesterase n=1 Tax=Telluribacter sp. SYSU D00476 TaxID=2811430 RepID=UPI001FF451B9|nr:sialate O-acetylesterase [Telluribacter sp. SYSU D00476]
MINFTPLVFLFCLLSHSLLAQLTITFPAEQTVLQRDPKTNIKVPVSGFAYLPFDRVEARLVALDGSLPVSEDWTLLATRPQQGSFTGSLAAQGGWYRLEVRGIMQDQPVDTVRVNRVGVGEVFLIAGNSNAMGLPNLGAKSASDQVLSFNALNKYLDYSDYLLKAPDQPMRHPVFTPLAANNAIYPGGESAWYWGELGDLLTKRLQVPILFLNASWPAANSENWREAADGRNTLNIYVGKNWPYQQPYTNLRNTLNYFHSWLGVRSVLWSHGENDAAHLKIAQERYYDNMQYLIRKSRQDFGANVPWMVALASVSTNLSTPYLPVVNAQKQLATTPGLNVWPGPDTDPIQVPRPQHGHFENATRGTQGLTEVAQAWNSSLTDLFFQQSTPILPRGFIHTGVVPAAAPPGSNFLISYRVEGSVPTDSRVQAELLAEDGSYVATVGYGSNSPLYVSLPDTLTGRKYHLRVVMQQPRLVGSLSEVLLVDRELASPQYIRRLTAYPTATEVTLYWLMAIDTQRRSMTVQKSLDRETYVDVGPVNSAPDSQNPRLYSFVDPDPDEQTAYYRIKTESHTGHIHYSPAVAIFRGDAPLLFTVFPNPAQSGPVFIRTDEAEGFEVELINQQGHSFPIRTRSSGVIGLSVIEPVSLLNPGVYTLKVVHDSNSYTQLIVLF